MTWQDFDNNKKAPLTSKNVKVPPSSFEAEQSVLGAILLDNRAWDQVADLLCPDDFYHPQHRFIYEGIKELAVRSQPFDVLTLSEVLRQSQSLSKVGGETFLYELVQNTPTAANVVSYSHIVREKSVYRSLIAAGSDIVDSAFNPANRSVKEILDLAEQQVFDIANQQSSGSGPVKISELVKSTKQHIDELFQAGGKMSGTPTGFVDMDKMMAGMQPGDMYVIAGRPSMGKTVYGMNVAEHVAIHGDKAVLIFSMEMTCEQITMRLLSSLGQVEQQKVRSGQLNDEDWRGISHAISLLSQANMFVDDTPALTPIDLRARARRLARQQGGLGLIVVDYLQLMSVTGSENRATEVSEISRSLKALAKELHVPVIALSQLNRSLESRTDKRPVMSDLRESGSIEQDADMIAFIYRDEVYNKDSVDKGKAEIIIRKQRNGPTGTFILTFEGQYTRFCNHVDTQVTSGVFI